MNNVLLIGASGFLGQHLAKYNPTVATVRFEDPIDLWQQYKDIDTVWLVARACRKTYPRRDATTKRVELQGIQRICNVFSDCHFVYTSTKVVYGLTDDDVRPCSREHIGNLFVHKFPHIQNVPHTNHDTVNLEPLGEEHRIYAETKLAAEDIIKSTVKSYSILRIWDIC